MCDEILMSFGSLYRTFKAESQNFKDPVLAKRESQYKARFKKYRSWLNIIEHYDQ